MTESIRENALAVSSPSLDEFGKKLKLTAQMFVLVVEDDPVVVEFIQEIVGALGFGVLVAENASDALFEFEQICNSTICVILDYSIPGMDASRLLSRMKEINADVKVLLSSGYSQSFIGKDFPLDSVAAFIAKPYEPQRLVDQLMKLVAANGQEGVVA